MSETSGTEPVEKPKGMGMTLAMLAIFSTMVGIALAFYPEGARFQPLVVGLPAIALCLLQLALDLRARSRGALPAPVSPAPTPPVIATEPEPPLLLHRELIVWGYFLGLIAIVLLAGFWVALPLFLVLFLATEAKIGWLKSLIYGIGATAALYAIFILGLRVTLHDGFIWQLL